MAKRIGLLTGGGDAPGQNVCLKALVHDAVDHGYEAIGIRKGWEGLMRYELDNPTSHGDNVINLFKSRVRDIDRTGGSFLHSSRLDPSCVNPQALPPFLRGSGKDDQPIDVTEHIQRVVAKLQVDALVVLGDRATLNYAARLSKEGVPVIGIPKTVHNTVSGSDYSLGFSTAVGRGVHFIHEIRAMAGSREEIAVVEILGRTSGLTTMLISLLAGADHTLIPEVAFDPERLAQLLKRAKQSNPNNYAILTLSEATSVVPEKVHAFLPELSRLANSRTLSDALEHGGREALGNQIRADMSGKREIGTHVIGSGSVVTEILENLLGERLLFQPLSYLIRTAEPDGQDLLGAANFAALAVRLLTEGKTGRLAAYRHHDNYIDLPIDVVTKPDTSLSLADFYDVATYYPRPGILWAGRI